MSKGPKITWEYLNRKIAFGEGSGFGDSYLPWIQIKRWNPSTISSQVFKPIHPFKRPCHFLSKKEYRLALIFSWIGGQFREQFPIWPWDHPHPETGRNPELDRYLAFSTGTLKLCKDAGIDHGNFIGTNIPYVWTIDFCMHLPWLKDQTKATALISVKPSYQINPKAYDHNRVLEKLEIERRYSKLIGASYFVGDHDAFPTRLMTNLDAIVSCASIPNNHYAHKIKHSFLDKHCYRLQDEHFGFTYEVLKRDFDCSDKAAALIQNNFMWNQIIDIDLSKTVIPNRTPIRGGVAMIAAYRKNMENGQ